MAAGPRVSPLLETLCKQLDQLFIAEVGPFGQFVVGEVRDKWTAAGPHVKTHDIEDYAVMLAEEIPEKRQRAEFIARARELLVRFR
jgi:hypothetical protein